MIDLVYICSAARSGSTLLNRLIGSHPMAVPGGEVSGLSRSIALNAVCSCGETVRACPFWRRVVTRIGTGAGCDLWVDPYCIDLGPVKGVVEVDLERQTALYVARRAVYMAWLELLLRAGVDVSSSKLAYRYGHWLEANSRLHDALRRESGRRLVVDSSKGFRFGVGLYRLRPANTRIILLSRDGRGVLASYLRSGMSLRSSVRNWTTYYARAMRWIEEYVAREHVLRVYYEKLVSDPESELNRIYQFLDLTPIDGIIKLQQGDSHILDGNRGVLKTAAEIKSDERWKRDLSKADLEYFALTGGDMMSKLGYSM